MRAYIISLLGSGTDADDILQEANLLLWERREAFLPGTSFKAWAFRVAYFKTLAHRRDRIRRDRIEFSESTLYLITERAQERFGEGDDRIDALRHCLTGLDESDRAMLTARYSSGNSLTEHAARIGKSIPAVHKAISRLRFALRSCVEKQLAKP